MGCCCSSKSLPPPEKFQCELCLEMHEVVYTCFRLECRSKKWCSKCLPDHLKTHVCADCKRLCCGEPVWLNKPPSEWKCSIVRRISSADGGESDLVDVDL